MVLSKFFPLSASVIWLFRACPSFYYLIWFWCNSSLMGKGKLANFALLQIQILELQFFCLGSERGEPESVYISSLATLPVCGFPHARWIVQKLEKSGSWQSKCTCWWTKWWSFMKFITYVDDFFILFLSYLDFLKNFWDKLNIMLHLKEQI